MKRGKTLSIFMFMMGLILTVILSVLALSAGTLAGGVNVSSLTNALNRSNYYTQLNQVMEQQAEVVTERCGLPVEIVQGVYDSEEIASITREYTVACLRGEAMKPDYDAVGERLRANLLSYMETEGMDKARISTKELKGYMEMTSCLYQETVNNALVTHGHDVLVHMRKFLMILSIVLFVVAIGVACLMYSMCRSKRMTHTYLIGSLIAAILLSLITAAWLYLTKSSMVLSIVTEISRGLADRLMIQIAGMILLVDACYLLAIMILGITKGHRRVREVD